MLKQPTCAVKQLLLLLTLTHIHTDFKRFCHNGFCPRSLYWKCVKKGSYNSQYEQGRRNDYSKQDLFQSSYGDGLDKVGTYPKGITLFQILKDNLQTLSIWKKKSQNNRTNKDSDSYFHYKQFKQWEGWLCLCAINHFHQQGAPSPWVCGNDQARWR